MNGHVLLRQYRQVMQWRQSGDILAQFHRSKVNEFLSKNSLRIDTLNKKITELQDKYFVVEEEQIKVDEKGLPIIKEGLHRKDFDREYNDLLSEPINIVYP